MTYIGRKKNRGSWYVQSELDGARHQREYPGLTEDQFYTSLRDECRLPFRMPYKDIYREVTENFHWNGQTFVRAAHS